jgi:hypothetical protein
MRVVKTERGYMDMDHVLHVGEPYNFRQGLYGFDVTFAFRDKAFQMLWYAEDLRDLTGDLDEPFHSIPAEQKILDAVRVKRDEFVKLWKGEE